MKLFTIAEANRLLADIEPELRKIREVYAEVRRLKDAAGAAAVASQFGGGMAGGTAYVNHLYEIGRLTTEIANAGVELKDYERGLIDFPSMRKDRVVYLCWQFGDGDEIAWWHETDAGFAGRQAL